MLEKYIFGLYLNAQCFLVGKFWDWKNTKGCKPYTGQKLTSTTEVT